LLLFWLLADSFCFPLAFGYSQFAALLLDFGIALIVRLVVSLLVSSFTFGLRGCSCTSAPRRIALVSSIVYFRLRVATCGSSYRLYFWLRAAHRQAARRIDFTFGFELHTGKRLVVSTLLLASSCYLQLDMQHWWCAGRSRAPEFYLGVAPCAPMIATEWWLTPPLTRLSLRGAPAPRRIDFGFPGFGGYHHMVVTNFS